ncbi:hypothetical protein [Microcoleus sp. Pol10D4]|uniref:hypothetical protein n=1 Tax=Microcoleus sp. Pol10D4 TaxID=3055387 RepID=UPI002FD597A5
MWRATYVTDTGKLYPYISLEVSDFFLPIIFTANAIRGAGFCTLPRNIQPRQAILWDTEGGEHKIEYPFRPASAEWIEFWREIRTNPLIISSKGIGEIRVIK